MKEGDLVVVLGKLNIKSGEDYTGKLVVGTYLGKVADNQVMVLLPSGFIFTGHERDVVPEETQI